VLGTGDVKGLVLVVALSTLRHSLRVDAASLPQWELGGSTVSKYHCDAVAVGQLAQFARVKVVLVTAL